MTIHSLTYKTSKTKVRRAKRVRVKIDKALMLKVKVRMAHRTWVPCQSVQGALRRELERQRGNVPNGENAEGIGKALDGAGRAMDDAEQALRENDLGGALDRQAQALEALREGMRQLGDQLSQNQEQDQDGQQGQSGGTTGGEERRDPLGRFAGNRGQAGSDEAMTEGEDVYRRAEELLDEIRRRSAEQQRPDDERDYLNRLLDRF